MDNHSATGNKTSQSLSFESCCNMRKARCIIQQPTCLSFYFARCPNISTVWWTNYKSSSKSVFFRAATIPEEQDIQHIHNSRLIQLILRIDSNKAALKYNEDYEYNMPTNIVIDIIAILFLYWRTLKFQ